MAMIACPECKAEVSSQARTCVKCGCPLAAPPLPAATKPGKPKGVAIAGIVAGVVSLGLLAVSGELALVAAVVALVLVVVAVVKRNAMALVLGGVVVALVAVSISGVGTFQAVSRVRAEVRSLNTAKHMKAAWQACVTYRESKGRWPDSLEEAVLAAGLPASAAMHDQTGSLLDIIYVRPAGTPTKQQPVIVENPAITKATNTVVIYSDGTSMRWNGGTAYAHWNTAKELSQRPAALNPGITRADWGQLAAW